MKNKALSSLRYSGIVTLSRIDGVRKTKIAQVHNEGYNPLFRFLANCLVGEFSEVDRPAKIKLLKQEYKSGEDNVTIEDYVDITGSVHLLTQPEAVHDPSRSLVRYSFIIPKDYIEGLDDLQNLCLGLYTRGTADSDVSNFAARCDISTTISPNDLSGASLAVDWELIIANYDYYETEYK